VVKVDKFIFDVGDRKVELSEQECVELKDKLNELFGQPMTPYYPLFPQPVWPTPQDNTPVWTTPIITC
jgi:hypothetical protein